MVVGSREGAKTRRQEGVFAIHVAINPFLD
jgi:hypothetical protein